MPRYIIKAIFLKFALEGLNDLLAMGGIFCGFNFGGMAPNRVQGYNQKQQEFQVSNQRFCNPSGGAP